MWVLLIVGWLWWGLVWVFWVCDGSGVVDVVVGVVDIIWSIFVECVCCVVGVIGYVVLVGRMNRYLVICVVSRDSWLIGGIGIDFVGVKG